MIVFGPVPSRRLGRSLGINNIPPKVCAYSCVYCQVGRTLKMRAERQAFYEPEQVAQAVRDGIGRAREATEPIDYLTFVPDGEPTLDVNLGHAIALLRPAAIPIAVISNGALIWRDDVRADLMAADWVSLKLDAIREEVWQRIDRPHGHLRLAAILEGMCEFSEAYEGDLVTETMLVAGVNDEDEHLVEIGDFLALLKPARAYLSIPTRPPAESWVRAPGEEGINRAYQILSKHGGADSRYPSVELLTGYEGNAFASTGDAAEDLLSVTAVHPMREEAVGEYLVRAKADWSLVRSLIARGQLIEVDYAGQKFYLRKLPRYSGL